jgi:hypothetical protein
MFDFPSWWSFAYVMVWGWQGLCVQGREPWEFQIWRKWNVKPELMVITSLYCRIWVWRHWYIQAWSFCLLKIHVSSPFFFFYIWVWLLLIKLPSVGDVEVSYFQAYPTNFTVHSWISCISFHFWIYSNQFSFSQGTRCGSTLKNHVVWGRDA